MQPASTPSPRSATPVALTIAGSDPSGGAGLQADLKTFHQHGVYGASVVTLLTVQNTLAVTRVEVLEPALVVEQIEAVVSDLPPAAAKTGALGSAGVIRAVAERARSFGFPLVVDPVMISKHGHALIDDEAVDALRSLLLPHAFLITPNLHEARRLSGIDITDDASAERAARAIAEAGPRHVLLKGVPGDPAHAADLLLTDGRVEVVQGPRHRTTNLHGSGCVFSAAVTALLARGVSVLAAARSAKAFTSEAIRTAPALGQGFGPLNTHATPEELSVAPSRTR